MKYNILIKYVNSIPSATKENKVDISRILFLCEKLGRVNAGEGYIYTSGGMYAHGCGMILESVLKSSGYPVARITDAYGLDIKRSIYIDGVSPSIDEFTNVLTYIRDILKKNKDVEFLREEVVFAICLYVSKISGVKYVILENTCEDVKAMFEICAPFNFAIIPRLYGSIEAYELDAVSACIDKVKTGVVTGNNQHFNYFSDKCHRAGIKLFIHRSVEMLDEKMRQMTFRYNKRDYTLKSSSEVLRDAAISSIELIDMMKNHGAKIPPSSIIEGVKNVGNCACFEVISISPMIICDISSTRGQLELVFARADQYCKNSGLVGMNVVFGDHENQALINDVFSKNNTALLTDVSGRSMKDAAETVLSENNGDKLTLILGSIEFTEMLKGAVKSKMDKF